MSATSDKRKSEELMKEAESVLVTLKDSPLMQNLWKAYQRKFSYAADYLWNDIMESAQKLAYEAGLSAEKPSIIKIIPNTTINNDSVDLPVQNSKTKEDIS